MLKIFNDNEPLPLSCTNDIPDRETLKGQRGAQFNFVYLCLPI